jgi:hypothetical protein
MTQSVTHRNTCRLCNSPQVELAVPMEPSPIADAYVPATKLNEAQEVFPLDLYLCRNCGHVQLLDVINPDILFRDYIYSTSTSLGLVNHFNKYAAEVVSKFPASQGSLAVDIGSNDGTLLSFFKSHGLKVIGIDPASGIAEKATNSGIETLAVFFTSTVAKEIRSRFGEAHYVTANNVFAHSDNLPDMADGIRELLAKDGVFVFEVSYLGDIIEKLLFDTVYHEHLCYHSIKPLQMFFNSHGLQLIDVERIASKGGSIRGFVQKKGGKHREATIVSDMLLREAETGLAVPETFAKYSARLDSIKSELRSVLSRMKQEGKAIAGYGASATVTTLLYKFGLGDFLEFLADDNVSRHGLLSPGLHLRIHPPSALIEKGIDATVILAWQYAKPILDKNQAYLDHGGAFVLPLPSVKIITKDQT